MSSKDSPAVEPTKLLREMEALAENAAAAIDQLLSQRRSVLETAQKRAAELDTQIQRLNELYKSANGRYYIPPPQEQKPSDEEVEEGKRARRSKEELKKMAEAIVQFIASKGGEGVSGAEIKALFPGITLSIKEFVQKYAGVTLRDNGAPKAAMRYLPPA
ncbi:MAG: hypothetical protein N2689_06310 [Verrucomicrobiae bacterium]|nr:hypothetical protein [Verrucomicrobiae bacterium]